MKTQASIRIRWPIQSLENDVNVARQESAHLMRFASACERWLIHYCKQRRSCARISPEISLEVESRSCEPLTHSEMSPPISFTKATLSYPIYSAAFDPYRSGYLVVGGGGGEGRSGVGNKLVSVVNQKSVDRR